MYLKETSSFFWLYQALQGLDVHFSMDAIFQVFSTAPMTLLSKELHPTLFCSRPSCHCLSLEEADEFCRHGALRIFLVLVPSRTTDHQEFTRTICAEGLKYHGAFHVPCFFQDSLKIHLRVVWVRRRFQLFNFHLLIFTFFRVVLRLCNDRSVFRTPHLVFHFENLLLLFR